jgi:benzoate/toluate 1,2-dioxygenase subunit alpha
MTATKTAMTATMLERSPDLSSKQPERKKSMLDTIQKTLDTAVEDDSASGVHRVSRDIFTNPGIFELEMKHIFEGNWIYLAHESQIPNKNDYFATYIGRQPIFIARNKNNEVSAFINACSHRGSMICRHKRGNKATFTCPFHGWTFSNSGRLLKVKDPDNAGYPEQFHVEGSRDLKKVARFESYRGFLFGSLNPDVKSLAEHLGETAKIIDMMVDQAPDGLEVLRGSSSYIYDGNWKLQAENGADGYHVSSLHWNYIATTSRRKAGSDDIKAVDLSNIAQLKGGYYSFENGHLMIWAQFADPTTRPAYAQFDKLVATHGRVKARWMVETLRNLCLYPNLFLMDQMSSQLRVARPLAVDKTEVTIYCIAPRNEPAEQRARRIRQYEDFFNASGMATPDDLEEFRACQQGYMGAAMRWNDLSRGAAHCIEGADEGAQEIDLHPLRSGVRIEDEGLFLVQHGHWADTLRAALVKGDAA